MSSGSERERKGKRGSGTDAANVLFLSSPAAACNRFGTARKRTDAVYHGPNLAFPIPERTTPVIRATVQKHVAKDAMVYTDEYAGYRRMKN
jgi:hypothetical protein